MIGNDAAEPHDHAPDARLALGASLGARVKFADGPRATDLTAKLARPEDIPDAAIELSRRCGMALATIVATDEQAEDGDLKLRYVFEPAMPGEATRSDRFVTLEVSLDPDRPQVPSVTADLPAANWHEREASDLMGISFVDHPDPRPLVVHDGWPKGLYPLRKDFDLRTRVPRKPAEEFPHLLVEGEGVFEIPVGPIHAGIIEPGHFRFSSVGETILHLEARLFYTHRGLEKRAEGMLADNAFFVAERLCGVCSVAHGLAFCEAVEQIAQTEVPRRARIIRTIALELERLYNHVGDIGNMCAGASYHYGTSAGLRIKEALQQVNECLAGNRFLRGLVQLGGARLDVPPEIAEIIVRAVDVADKGLSDLEQRIDLNPSVVDRFEGTGILPRSAAIDLGVTGVAARASGVDRDARRDHPHAAYAFRQGSVRVKLDEVGDAYARLRVRAREAHESVRLLCELLAILKAHDDEPLSAPLPARLPEGRIGIASVESPRGASVHWVRSARDGTIDRYHVRSASFANWPAVPIAAHTAIVPDFPLVNKSFELCYSCTDR